MKAAFAALTVLLTACGCATAPAPVKPADTPIAVLGEFECGELQGIVVITKDGKINPINDNSIADLEALAKKVPEGSAGWINMTDNCPPRQTT